MHTPISLWRLAVLVLASSALVPCGARAQDAPPDERRPIPRFAADVRGAMPRFKQDAAIAAGAGVTAANLPTRGRGLAFGAHVYPVRAGVVAIGIGGEVLTSRASRTLEAATEEGEDGPTAKTRFSAVSPQVSLNFGKHDGWSYISGGLGWSTFSVEREDSAAPASMADDERRKTINYGGGARWFAKEHVAVSIDLRFYAVSPQAATAVRPAMPRMTLMVFSVGASFK